jgi:LuxR family transcriptional regulator, maltose regulon positive regulatory protein
MPSTHVRGAARGPRQASGDPVLLSKITMPGLPDWAITRPRIDKLMEKGTRGTLTSVTGPPGAGKTMAIASWAAARSIPYTPAWVTLDDYDNRPRVFWSYVAAALRKAGIAVPRIPPGPGRDAIDHAFLLRLASVLAGQDPPVVMVLDDLHLLTRPAIFDGLAYLLRNARPGLHLVVAARSDPLLPLQRYRLTGELAEIRADDLAFSVEESGSLLAHHGIRLPAAALECLTERTEGWAAGLRLAALSMHGRSDPGRFVTELDVEDNGITGYLVDEVLSNQPESVRDMLLRTSILDCVNAELAGVLADDPKAADALPTLARANAFVLPIGGGWYRYHSLFGELLRLKLRLEHRGQLPDLYRRAARWYQCHDGLTEAVRYAAESGDWQFAADIVVDELAVGRLIEARDHPLADAFLTMPREPGWTHPRPLLILAATTLPGSAGETSVTSLAAAEEMLGRLPAGDEIPGRLAAALIRLALGRRTGDLQAATTAAARAEILFGQLPEQVRARHQELRVQMLAARGALELWTGGLDAAAAAYGAGIAACTPADADERADCLGHLALLEALQGRLSLAVEHATEAADALQSSRGDQAGHITAAASVALAAVHLQRTDMQEAQAQLKLAEATLAIWPDKLVSAVTCMVAAQRHLAEGRAAAATELIRQARQDWSSSPPGWLELELTILESQACLASGDIQAAVAAARRADPECVSDAAAALAHAWLAFGDQQAARRVLEAVAGEETLDGEPQLTSGAGLLADARLSYRTGDSTRGRASLERALQLARPEQVRLPFAMERSWIRPVLRRDPELARAYGDLLEPGPAAFSHEGQQPEGTAAPRVAEKLSGREREVLTHLSELLSTAEIATEMYLSVNTVKTHLRSIYRKLSVAHRSEAVRRARKLELIP